MYSEKIIEEGNELMEWCKERVINARKVSNGNLKLVAYGLASSLVESMMERHQKDSERYNYLKEMSNYLYNLI